MKCPFCKSDDTQVIDSRVSDDGESIRRRRRCTSCNKRFTTYETVELRMPQVVKQDGTRAEFEVWFGGYLNSPTVDFAAETPTVVWE